MDETRLASLDLPPRQKATIEKRAIVLDPADARPSCIGLLCLLIVALGLQRSPPGAFNNEPAGVKHRPAALLSKTPSRVRTKRGICWSAAFCLPAARPRPLLVSSTQPVSARAAVTTRLLLCPRTNATLLTLRDAGIVHPSCTRCSLSSTTRRFPGTSTLAPPSFAASQTEDLHQLLVKVERSAVLYLYLINTYTRPSRHGAFLHFQAAFQRFSPSQPRPGRPRNP
jgi:hypothetical protein